MPPRPRIPGLPPRLGSLRPRAMTPNLCFGIPNTQAAFTTTAAAKAVGTTAHADGKSHHSPLPAPPSRWVSDVRARVGKCIGFGCDKTQVRQAAGIMETLAREWRELSAGSDGFLTGGRKGLEDQQVVWGEMDSFGHVNNTVYIRYAESARVNWILHFAADNPSHREAWKGLMRPETIGLIMRSITADYKFPMTAPDTISVYHRLRIPPEPTHTSLFLDCVVLSHGHRRIAARTTEDVAIYDYRIARRTTLPGFMLDTLQETWRLQEARTERARRKIWGLLDDVERLEKSTWDRSDAVEDMGSGPAIKG